MHDNCKYCQGVTIKEYHDVQLTGELHQNLSPFVVQTKRFHQLSNLFLI